MIRTFTTMGTVASLRLPSSSNDADVVLASVQQVFSELDLRFSLYRPDSEASRIARNELSLVASSPAMREMYSLALTWRDATGGVFTPHRPDGVIDLSGVVKAAAIQSAGTVLDAAGLDDWLLNVGGDVLARGTDDGTPWRAGIVDPEARDALLTAVRLDEHRRAIATSGTSERGEHVWRRATRAGADLVQVTVVAPDIITADVLATAVLAGGIPTLDDIVDRFDVDVLACGRDGALLATPRLRSSMNGTFDSGHLDRRQRV